MVVREHVPIETAKAEVSTELRGEGDVERGVGSEVIVDNSAKTKFTLGKTGGDAAM